jgi:hypothetical protein
MEIEFTDVVKQDVLDDLNSLTEGVPVEWDRVSVGKAHIVVFGWIPDKATRKDFIIYYRHYISILGEYWSNFVTSSAKYSDHLASNWDVIHLDCIKFTEFFGE